MRKIIYFLCIWSQTPNLAGVSKTAHASIVILKIKTHKHAGFCHFLPYY